MTPERQKAARLLRAYGDRRGDGMLQMSFVLEIPIGDHGRAVAKEFAALHGLHDPLVATMEACAAGLTFFVVYGRSQHAIDPDEVEVEAVDAEALALPPEAVVERVHARHRRKLVVVGACTGADAHTVGIDAIFNYKGIAGDKGLESYACFDVHNLGGQVDNGTLAEAAIALKADAVLVSQIVTQRDCHKANAAELIELARRQGWRDRTMILLGGPRIDHALALELGFDAGFGPGTRPSNVASFLALRVR